MMKRSGIGAVVAFVLLSLVVLPGCGGSGASVAGKYELDKEAVKTAVNKKMEEEAAKEGADDGMAVFLIGMIDQAVMDLTLNEDNTATMMITMMGDTDNANGTWAVTGKTIVITLAPEGEEPDSMSGTVSGDTITLKPESDEDMPFDLVFKKKG